MAALQYVDVPGYKALLLRKTFPELSQPSGLIDRLQEWLAGTDAKWNEQKHRWRFPSGAIVEFGYLHRSTDRYRYQGAELDFIGFDELTHFDEEDYLYLFSRLRRRSDSNIPPRMRAATNPGGRGHGWVKRRFIDKRPRPGDPDDTPERCSERIFIPAKLEDNPGVDRLQYGESLAMLDPQTRAQLEEGDWNARGPGNWAFDHLAIDAAQALGERFDGYRAAETMPPPVDGHLALGVDWGDFATHGLIIWPLERGGIYIPPTEVAMSRADVEGIALALLKAAAAYPFWLAQERYDSSFAQSNRTFVKVAEQRLGPHNAVKQTGRPDTYKVSFAKSKLLAIRYIRLLLRRTREGKDTRVLAISPQNEVLLEQLRGYGYKENDPERFEKGDDDAVDALIAGVAPVARKHRKVVEAEIAEAKRKLDEENRERAARGAQRRFPPEGG